MIVFHGLQGFTTVPLEKYGRQEEVKMRQGTNNITEEKVDGMDRGYDLISSGPVQGVDMKKYLKGQIRGLCHALLSVSHSDC